MKTQLCQIKNKMLAMIMAQMDHLEDVDVCELGEAIDIIKDIAEAEYYAHQIQNVNAYLHTLEDNIRKMMDTMSPEERMMMRDKLHDLEQIL